LRTFTFVCFEHPNAMMLSDWLAPALLPWGSGGVAFVLAVGLTPIVHRIARWGGWVAIPESDKWHDTPTTLLGGVAIFVGAAVVLGLGGGRAAFPPAVWAGAGLLFVAGTVDDLWGLGPAAKLLLQVGSAVLVVTSGLLFVPAAPLWVSIPLTLVWVLGLTNALNLLDAMDGVAASVATLAAVLFGVVAGLQGQWLLASGGTVLAGATAGFLVYNVAPARIFMGDCGSLVLGYGLAILGIGVQGAGSTASALVPVFVLAVPIFDTTFVSVTRTRRGESVANGGVDHTMHRLVRLGWSERQAMLLMGGGGLLAGGIGLVGQVGPALLFYVLVVGALATALGIGYILAVRTAPGSVKKPRAEPVKTLNSVSSNGTPAQADVDDPVSKKSLS
jgi:UDP-GlcNAc:undecaprenyl-phosphate GlcNAc-1-phosphate transferase